MPVPGWMQQGRGGMGVAGQDPMRSAVAGALRRPGMAGPSGPMGSIMGQMAGAGGGPQSNPYQQLMGQMPGADRSFIGQTNSPMGPGGPGNALTGAPSSGMIPGSGMSMDQLMKTQAQGMKPGMAPGPMPGGPNQFGPAPMPQMAPQFASQMGSAQMPGAGGMTGDPRARAMMAQGMMGGQPNQANLGQLPGLGGGGVSLNMGSLYGR